MNALRLRSRSQSGQVLVLGALCCLVLAVTVFSVLNVERRVHERIRLQNFADERAYSLAVQEARTFNYMAYSNRAIAAGLVAMATLHSYMTEAAMTTDIDFGMFLIMMEIAAFEIGECFCYWGLPLCPWHCWHAAEAVINGAAYIIKWIGGEIKNNVQKLDDKFKLAMQALGAHLSALYYSQLALVYAMDFLLVSNEQIGDIQQKTMGGKSVSEGMVGFGVGVMNASKFNDAINMKSDNTSKAQRAREMTAVANGSRPGFTWDRGGALGPPTVPNILLTPTKDTVAKQKVIGPNPSLYIFQTPQTGAIPQAGGRTAVTAGAFPGIIGGMVWDADPNTTGNSVASFDWGMVGASFECGYGVAEMPLLAIIGPGELISSNTSLVKSGESTQGANERNNRMNDADNKLNNARNQINSGDVKKKLSKDQLAQANQAINDAQKGLNNAKKGGASGDTRHRVDLGIPIGDPHKSTDHSKLAPDTVSWVDFAYSTDKSKRNNQPVVYAAYSSETRDNDVSNKAPWEINGGVSVSFNNEKGKLDFRTNSQATAVSKAMVYYHRLGYWKEPPNFFNPYWRAKLESLDSQTEMAALVAAGGLQAEGLANAAALKYRGGVNIKDSQGN